MSVDLKNIVLENKHFRLIIGSDGCAKSLIYKPLNEECLAKGEDIACFSVTQERPFNNEIKLSHPNKRTTFQANKLRYEDNKLIIGFELAPYEAVVEVKITDYYIAFTLSDFIVPYEAYYSLIMSVPPVAEMRFLQLPVRNRARFGEWLNVAWDEKVAVNVLSTSPFARIEAERRKRYRIMSADAVKGVKLRGTGAALAVNSPDKLLDTIDRIEEDYNLPRGAKSRKSQMLNVSYYWTGNATPENIDEHIKYAKMGGFRMMLLYYTCIVEEIGSYSLNGNYDYRKEYPDGKNDLHKMIKKIKEAGIIPGLHFLHTHIGLSCRYVAPVADHRLNLTTRFTLARAMDRKDTKIYTEQNPQDSVMADKCRVLKIDGELVTYKGYSTEIPYCFTGVERGAYNTKIDSYPAGRAIGILDISEFGANNVYIDQNSNMQDEIADKIADIYNTGFEFVYFDGSEGVNPPFDFHVPNAQYRVYKKLNPAPLFAEGAAKAHFSWHMLSGGNAFDVFAPEIFKEKIRQFPVEEAPRMRNDFTRLNFGWWGYWAPGTQPDMMEYATSRAAAWDCPISLQGNLDKFKTHPRTVDNLETIRRWEDVRAKNWLTDKQKEMLKTLDQEHILLINEYNEYELVPYDEVPTAANGNKELRVFIFERNGESYAVYWHASGSGELRLPLDARKTAAVCMKELGSEIILHNSDNNIITITINDRHYLKCNLSKQELIKVFEKAVLI